ncbi:MAG: ABC transporter permease [Phenylobacterium sp.]|nr:MAG: ABC transporter permease [Phenylobacterium sp.]
MNPLLLVAAREFRQIAATRSFWITLLAIPIFIVGSQIAGRMLATPTGVAYTLADPSGRYAPAIRARIQRDNDRDVLDDLASYASRWKIAPQGGQAVWGLGPHWFTEGEIAQFEAAGGLPGAQAEIARLKPKNAPNFSPPHVHVVEVAPPAGVVTTEGPERFGATLAPHLKADIATPVGPRSLALGVYVPANLGEPGATVAMWTNGRPSEDLIDEVRGEISQVLRVRALQASGVDVAALARVQAITAPVSLSVPPAGSGRERMLLRSALPLALAYLLLLSLVISGAWMLQSLLEERSNKLLEAVLACITPNQLLYGKLLGVLGVSAVMILVWIGFAIGGAFAFQGVIADFVRPLLSSLTSPWTALVLIYFFVAGYLCFAMVYLAVGSVSDNMRDAQGYLMPLTFTIILPFMLLANAVLRNPDGVLPKVMTWIPLYTPFAVMARLGGGISALEIVGSGLLLAAFIGLEFVLVGRLFRASLLQAGGKMKLRDLPALMRTRPA